MVTCSYGFDAAFPAYGRLLKQYVCHGGVAYDRLKNDQRILSAAEQESASATRAQIAALPANAQIAYYVNVYNLFTLDLIIKHLPLKQGIRDIDDPWKQRFIHFFGDTVSLDYIEHKILRKEFKEPRIHFALVCASKSCPVLSATPYTGDSLDMQLGGAAQRFLKDTTRNQFDSSGWHLSKIFDWYGDDFKGVYGSYQSFLAKTLGIPAGAKTSFNEYDWSLNRIDRCD
jgi:hypothetical protein